MPPSPHRCLSGFAGPWLSGLAGPCLSGFAGPCLFGFAGPWLSGLAGPCLSGLAGPATACVVAAAGLAAAFSPTTTPVTAATPSCAHAEVLASAEPELAAQAILCLLNRERAARAMSPLRRNPSLTAAASGHSRDMVRRRYFAHTTPGRVTFARRIERSRYARGAAAKLGENLAWGMGEPAAPTAVVRGWMQSPEHRANVLDPAFRSIGIGIAPGVPVATASAAAPTGATYTTDFGSR